MRTNVARGHRETLFLPHLAAGAFIVLWLDVGVASAFMTALPGVVKISVLGLWLFIAAARSMPFFGTLTVNAWPLAAMLLVTILYAAEVAQSGQYTQGIGYLLIAFALSCFYAQEHVRRERNVLMGVMLADLAVTGARTLVALQTDPQLARYLATTEENRSEVYGAQSFAGLGGYGYAYSLAALLVVILYFLVRSTRKAGLITVLGFGMLVLVEMAFTTSIILVLVLGVGFVIHDLVRKPGLRMMLYATAIIGWISGVYTATLTAVAALPWVSPDVQVRLVELARFLAGESSTGSDLGTRVERWTDSVEAFMSSGVFGLAGRGGTNQETGGHSQWLDLLASYGLWLLLPAIFLAFAWRLCRTRLSPVGAGAVGRAWVFFLVLGLVNTLLFSTIVLTWMFLLPALAEWLGGRVHSRAAPALQEVNT